ncbi:MAG: DNA repair protein RecO [Pelagibacteraceae bacterium TMED247]|nr:DNA repair protein RecO [Candidatus Pelagibacter sp.]RPG05795.1 MAG: DNA repair protein RecO [Pelagibacteraceae bacterium TMED247]|tara:strand:+ start:15108 stop:15785 length:678 start_codon:yes stop_codon:yes gene_type:complete
MNWEDEGFIIAKRKFRENAIILEVFTSKYGKVNGIVYGGNSRKIRNYLQLINKIFISYNSKGENRIGYFKTELINAISPEYFDNKNKILCINSLSSILKAVLPENLSSEKIYKSLENLLKSLKNNDWLTNYLVWEINLINYLGFGFNIDNKNFSDKNYKKIYDIKLDNINYKIPGFLVFKNYSNPDNNDIYNGLNFSRTLMENKFFIPNNINFPYSRKLLEKNFL